MLSNYRKKLDKIDEQIITLLLERKRVCKCIGDWKKKEGIEPLNLKEKHRREQMYSQVGKNLYEEIHKISIYEQL